MSRGIVTAVACSIVLAGCGARAGNQGGSSTPAGGNQALAATVEAPDSSAGSEEAALPSAEGTGSSNSDGEVPSGSDRANARSCDKYRICCLAYGESLAKGGIISESSGDAHMKSCEQIDQMKDMPDGEEACSDALIQLKQTGEAFKDFPGFVWPEVCK